MQTEVFITSEYITLGQFLKFENIIESGGNVKFFLEEIPVYINNELYPGDVIVIDEVGEFVIVAE